MRRRGAWALPTCSLVTNDQTHKERDKNTHTQKFEGLYEEERCFGTLKLLPHHMTTECTREGHVNTKPEVWTL